MINVFQIAYASYVPLYSTIIRNIGINKFSEAKIVLNKKTLRFGWISPGKYAAIVYPRTQIPEKALVSWQRENGIVYEQEVELKSKLPKLGKEQEYYLIFDINDDNNAKLKVVICSKEENCIDKW